MLTYLTPDSDVYLNHQNLNFAEAPSIGEAIRTRYDTPRQLDLDFRDVTAGFEEPIVLFVGRQSVNSLGVEDLQSGEKITEKGRFGGDYLALVELQDTSRQIRLMDLGDDLEIAPYAEVYNVQGDTVIPFRPGDDALSNDGYDLTYQQQDGDGGAAWVNDTGGDAGYLDLSMKTPLRQFENPVATFYTANKTVQTGFYDWHSGTKFADPELSATTGIVPIDLTNCTGRLYVGGLIDKSALYPYMTVRELQT